MENRKFKRRLMSDNDVVKSYIHLNEFVFTDPP